jgi:arginase family enzyme
LDLARLSGYLPLPAQLYAVVASTFGALLSAPNRVALAPDSGRLASLDMMELNPAFDVRNRTAEVAVDLLASLFGKSTLMRR